MPDDAGTPGWRERLAAALAMYDGQVATGHRVTVGRSVVSVHPEDLRASLAAASVPQEGPGGRVEERWLVEYEDRSVTDGWTEETARAAADAREPRYSGETTYARRAVRDWRYAPSDWAAGEPPPAGPPVGREALLTPRERDRIIRAAMGELLPDWRGDRDVRFAESVIDKTTAARVLLLGSRQVDRDALATCLREAFPAREFLWREGDTFGRLTPETLADLLAKAITDG